VSVTNEQTGGVHRADIVVMQTAKLERVGQPPIPSLSSRAQHERPKDGHAEPRDPMPADTEQRPEKEFSDFGFDFDLDLPQPCRGGLRCCLRY
jgi:hypothetical protein